MFGFFMQSNLITSDQSDIKTSDRSITQLLSIIHEIYKSLNDGYYELREVFLIEIISKAFD